MNLSSPRMKKRFPQEKTPDFVKNLLRAMFYHTLWQIMLIQEKLFF